MPHGGWKSGKSHWLRHETINRHESSPRWTPFFAASHIEAIHWSVIGKADAPDIEIMEYAKTNDYAVFTNDLAIDPRKARITMLPL